MNEAGKSRGVAQIKFGPSAWHANEVDRAWKTTVSVAEADYSRLFITAGKEVRQSAVSIQEALDGILDNDDRLAGELIRLVETQTASAEENVLPDET